MRIVSLILSLPKTIYFNLRALPLIQALKLPVLVHWRTKFRSLQGKVIIVAPLRAGMVRIGFGGSGTASYSPNVLQLNGTCIFNDDISFGGGNQLSISKNAILKIGEHSRFMGECHLVATNEIQIGSYCAISWNTQIMDTDFHKIYASGQILNPNKKIMIGDRIWIASHVTVNKGAVIPDGCIVASHSLANHSFSDKKCLIAGVPGKSIRTDTDWEI